MWVLYIGMLRLMTHNVTHDGPTWVQTRTLQANVCGHVKEVLLNCYQGLFAMGLLKVLGPVVMLI